MKYQFIIRELNKNLTLFKILRNIKSLKTPISYYRISHKSEIDIVNCGIPRSGSTLLSMIINEILQLEYKSQYNFVSDELGYKKLLGKHRYYKFSKIHIYSPLIAKRIKTNKCIGFLTHRDIRDIIVSRLQKGWISNIENYIKCGDNRIHINNALLYAKVKNINLISYYDLLNNTLDIIKQISIKLNITLTEGDISIISEKVSLSTSKNKLKEAKFIKRGKRNDLVDPCSGLHKNHINDPSIGKWKNILTREQVKIINEDSKDYLELFNYD